MLCSPALDRPVLLSSPSLNICMRPPLFQALLLLIAVLRLPAPLSAQSSPQLGLFQQPAVSTSLSFYTDWNSGPYPSTSPLSLMSGGGAFYFQVPWVSFECGTSEDAQYFYPDPSANAAFQSSPPSLATLADTVNPATSSYYPPFQLSYGNAAQTGAYLQVQYEPQGTSTATSPAWCLQQTVTANGTVPTYCVPATGNSSDSLSLVLSPTLNFTFARGALVMMQRAPSGQPSFWLVGRTVMTCCRTHRRSMSWSGTTRRPTTRW